MTLDEEIRLGDRAAQLLQDEVLALAIDTIKADCMSRWENSPAHDAAGREKIWQLFKMTDAVSKELRKMVDAGTMARAKVAQENRVREFEKEHGFRPHI